MNTMLQPISAGILVRMIAANGPSTAMEIGRDSGLATRDDAKTFAHLGVSLMAPIVRFGAAYQSGRKPVCFDITEKGRIAVALFRAIANRRSMQCK